MEVVWKILNFFTGNIKRKIHERKKEMDIRKVNKNISRERYNAAFQHFAS